MRSICRPFSTSSIRRFQNHYEVLGVSVNATADQIKKQFFELSKRYHPDRNKDADPGRYQQITAAYTVLSSDADRKKFDETLGNAVRRPQGYHSGRTWDSGDSAASSARQRRPGTSGYSYNLHKMNAHRARHSSKLDPLRPQYQNNSVPHFNFAQHAQNQQRYEEYRRAQREQTRAHAKAAGTFKHSAASASMGSEERSDPHSAGASFMAKAAGFTAATVGIVYLLLR